MKQGEAIKAYKSAIYLNQQKLSGSMAKKVFLLTKALQPVWDFQVQEEDKIFADHPMYDPSINGIRMPDDPEEKKKAILEVEQINKELKVIGEVDSDVEFEKFDFDLSAEQIKLSGEDIGNLGPFINFI